MKRDFAALVLLVLLSLASCGNSGDSVVIHTATGDVPVAIEIANNTAEQAIGLMYRDFLDENSGMLFVFSDTTQRIFWMKNTQIPLDILFFDENGTLVDMKENFAPCVADPCELYYSQPAFTVLEVNAGFAATHGIVLRDSISLQ